jgi:hypothetical protein
MSNNGEKDFSNSFRRRRLSSIFKQNLQTILWIVVIGLLIGLCLYLSFNWDFLTG